jgi:hypothetical protein
MVSANVAAAVCWAVTKAPPAATYGGSPTSAAHREELAVHLWLLRDIFGNSFRPVAIDPAWQMSTVAQLAQAAYDERELPSGHLDPARLAVLADALEVAGCTNADILAHLREPGPHVRGCWAVDLVLGKA